MPDPITITGLREYLRALKKMDADLPKAVRVVLNKAADLVIDLARPDVPSRSGRAARSIRGQSTRTAVRVTAGGKRAPYYPWLDFGGRVGRKKSTRRPFDPEGRYLYPAYFDLRNEGTLIEVMSAGLVELAETAGFEVT
jgi:hypothetical protein